LKSAYKYCEKFTKEHYENFPVASLMFPKEKRNYIYAIYTFARMADDIADSQFLNQKEKLEKLSKFEYYLNNDGLPEEENMKLMITALRHTIKTKNLGKEDFMNLLTAFKQDSVNSCYKTYDEILKYSSYSANPVGRLVLKLSGFDIKKDSDLFYYSDKICTALQLINFWQDVSRDIIINRVYIPKEIMEMNSYTYTDLYNHVQDGRYRRIVSKLVNETEKILYQGRNLSKMLKGMLKYEFKAIYNSGKIILKKIRKIEFNTLNKRVKLHNKDKILILIKSLFFDL